MNPGMVQRVQDSPHNRLNATPFVKPFQLPPALLEEVFTSPDYRRFTVVREPAARLLSGYIEKIGQGLKQSEPIVAALKQSTGRDVAAADITLDQFLDVIGAQESRDQDPHWRRQADHVGLGIVALRRDHPPRGARCVLGDDRRAHLDTGAAGAVLLPQLHRCPQPHAGLLHARTPRAGRRGLRTRLLRARLRTPEGVRHDHPATLVHRDRRGPLAVVHPAVPGHGGRGRRPGGRGSAHRRDGPPALADPRRGLRSGPHGCRAVRARAPRRRRGRGPRADRGGAAGPPGSPMARGRPVDTGHSPTSASPSPSMRPSSPAT